jgi:uncharacterized membrane protein
VARFAYLQEGIDYCHEGARQGCRMLLVSRIALPAMTWHYVPEGTTIALTPEGHVPGNVRMVPRDCNQTRGSDHYCEEVRK